jgi:hypothetical protein
MANSAPSVGFVFVARLIYCRANVAGRIKLDKVRKVITGYAMSIGGSFAPGAHKVLPYNRDYDAGSKQPQASIRLPYKLNER